jgi:CheY-like chemotaxis protein
MSQLATILLVDDNVLNMIVTADVLEYAGYAVLRAENVAEAQVILQRTMPNLVLLDIQMPGMDGLTFTRLLKADPAYRSIPVVALTALAMRGDDQKALAAGCDGYITKPIDTRKLPDQVAEILQRSSLLKHTEPPPG